MSHSHHRDILVILERAFLDLAQLGPVFAASMQRGVPFAREGVWESQIVPAGSFDKSGCLPVLEGAPA